MIIQKLRDREKVQAHKIANKVNKIIEELNKQEENAKQGIKIREYETQ